MQTSDANASREFFCCLKTSPLIPRSGAAASRRMRPPIPERAGLMVRDAAKRPVLTMRVMAAKETRPLGERGRFVESLGVVWGSLIARTFPWGRGARGISLSTHHGLT